MKKMIRKKHQGSKRALIIIDMLNKLDFPEGKQLLKFAIPAAEHILKLKKHLKQQQVPVIYANDNFGMWKSDRKQVIARCIHEKSLGAPLAKILMPEEDDYFVLKPKHSAFFSTTLEPLLTYFEAETLILTGIAGNICVFHTALDAHVRNYRLIIPQDCIASNTKVEQSFALNQMKAVLQADIASSKKWLKKST